MEGQAYLNPELIKFKVSKNKEELETIIKNWTEPHQLSDIGHVNDKYYISYPNVYSKSIRKAIDRTEKLLDLNVSMNFNWIVGRNWAECH